MSVGSWISVDNKAQKVKDLFVGVNGKARKIIAGYVGVNNKARQIYPAGILVPSISGSYVYDGTEQTVQLSGYDESFINISGYTSAIDAGPYTVVLSLKYPGLEWEDGTTNDKNLIWNIDKAILPYPTQSNDLEYTGDDQSPMWNNFDTNMLTITEGVTSTEQRGEFPVTFRIKSEYGRNYQFANNSSDCRVTWKIKTAVCHLDYSDVDNKTFRVGQGITASIRILNSKNQYVHTDKGFTHQTDAIAIACNADYWDTCLFEITSRSYDKYTGRLTFTITGRSAGTDSFWLLKQAEYHNQSWVFEGPFQEFHYIRIA